MTDSVFFFFSIYVICSAFGLLLEFTVNLIMVKD